MELMKCPVCGRSFIKAPYHVYKTVINGKVKYLCGWNCLRKLEIGDKKDLKEVKQDADR